MSEGESILQCLSDYELANKGHVDTRSKTSTVASSMDFIEPRAPWRLTHNIH